MTRQVTDQLYIELEYFTPEEYFVYVAEASVSMSSSFNQTSNGNRFRDNNATLECQVIQSQEVNRIRDVEAPLGTMFAASLNVIATVNTGSVMNSSVSMVIDVERNRAVDVALATIVTQSLQNDRIRDTQSAVTSIYSLSTDASATRELTSNVASSFTQSTTAQKLVLASANISSVSSLTSSVTRLSRTPRRVELDTIVPGSFNTSVKKFGTASLFQRARLYDGDTFQLSNTDWTIDLQFNSLNRVSNRTFLNIRNTNALTVISLTWNSSERTFSTGTRYSGANILTNTTTGTYSETQWHHLRFSSQLVSGTRYFTLWVNGSRQIQYSTTTQLLDSTVDTNIGADVSQWSWVFGTTDVYIDELLIKRVALTPYTTTSFTPPAQAYTNDLTTDLLLHFDGTTEDDATAPARLVSAVIPTQVRFTQAAIANTIDNGIIQLSSLATVSANVEKVIDASSVQLSAFTQTTGVGLVKTAEINVNSASQLFVSADVAKVAEANLLSEFTQSLDYIRIKEFDVQFTAIVSQISVTAKVGDYLININSQFNQTTDATIVSDSIATVDGAFTQSVDGNLIKQLDSNLTATSNIIIDADSILGGLSNQTSNFNLAIEPSNIIDFNISLTVFYVDITIGDITGEAIVNISVASNLSIDATIIKSAVFSANSEFNQTATGTTVVDFTAQLQSNNQLTALGQSIVAFNSLLNSTATLSVDARKITSNIIFEPVVSLITIDADVIGSNTIKLTAISNLSATVDKVKNASVSITALYSQMTVGSELSSAIVSMSVNSSLSVSGRLLVLDDILTYKIPRENRTYKIVKERRQYIIVEERRTYTVPD